MSKKTVTPATAPKQDTIPLSDIAITWYRQPHFSDEDKKPLVITGRQLGQVLSWLARTQPGTIGDNANTEHVWNAGQITLELEGMSEILRCLASAELEAIPADMSKLFYALAERAEDVTGRLSAVEDGENEMKSATVTIARREKAVA